MLRLRPLHLAAPAAAAALLFFPALVSAQSSPASVPASAPAFAPLAAGPTCTSPAGAKSASSTTVEPLTVTNHTAQTLSLYWFDFSGNKVHYQDIPAGETVQQSTFLGHVWLLTDQHSNCLDLFTITGQTTVSVGQTTSSPDPSLATARLSGKWNLQSTVTSITPGAGVPTSDYPQLEATATSTVNIIPTCPSGACSVTIVASSSESGIPPSGLFVVPGPDTTYDLLQQQGATYAYSPSGFGGPCVAGSPPHYFAGGTTLQVVAASGGQATQVDGSQTVVAFACVGGRVVNFRYQLVIGKGTPVASQRILPPLPSLPAAPGLGFLDSHSSAPPISNDLANPSQVFAVPSHTLFNILLAAAATLFITFPAQLFNHTLDENWADIRRKLVKVTHLPKRLAEPKVSDPLAPGRSPLPIFLIVLALGALLGAALNPGFGVNIPTGLALLGSSLTIAWGLWLSYRLTRSFRSLRHQQTATYLKALPAGLAVAGLCVLVSRLTDFAPGYLYGVVYSIAFVQKLPKHHDGQLTTLTVNTSLLIAIAAWLGWSPLHNISATGVGAIPLLVGTSVLASLFIGGLIGNLIGLFPLTFLAGHKIFRWRRPVWFAVFGLTVFLFLEILLLPARGGHSTHAAVITVIALFVAFSAISVGFWGFFALRKRSAAKTAAAQEAQAQLTQSEPAPSPAEPPASSPTVQPATTPMTAPSDAPPQPPVNA